MFLYFTKNLSSEIIGKGMSSCGSSDTPGSFYLYQEAAKIGLFWPNAHLTD